MKTWQSVKTRKRWLEQRELARNPLPGLSNKNRKRIDTAVNRVYSVLMEWLTETEMRPMKGWLPYEDIISTVDDERQLEFKEAYSAFGAYDKDTGLLTQMNDPGIKATNRITAATWYQGANDRAFFLTKHIYSPLPHDEWGTLPLTLRNWEKLALLLIQTRVLWQWQPAVAHYLGDESFMAADSVTGIVGWHLDPAVRTSSIKTSEGNETWTGQVILLPTIRQFSLD